MDKEIEKRRSWLRKKKNGFGEGGTSPTPVKLFDEQEVARILEDQVRSQQEQIDCTLREVDEKYSQKEKTINEKLDSVSKKLSSALAEINAKDNLVKQHIKVSEEAVIGWERVEIESAAIRLQRDVAIQQKLAAEDRVQHLDGALNEVRKQLRSGREELEQRIYEIMVTKTREFDNLREEMELKLGEASHSLAQMRTELMESRAENAVLSNALQERSRALAVVKDAKTLAETNMNVLQVRLEGMEKDNVGLKYDIRLVTKGLEARTSELEHARKQLACSDVTSKQLAEALKKVSKLSEECNRLRILVRKKTPSNAAMTRLKQDMDPLGSDSGRSPRRRALGRSQTGVDHISQQEEENMQLCLVANAPAEKILNLQEETRMLKEVLYKRSDELQEAKILCAKTTSRLSSVEEEVEALRLASRSALQVEKVSPEEWTSNRNELSSKTLSSTRDSLNFELMDDFEEMERLTNSQSQVHSSYGSEHIVEAALAFGAAEDLTLKLRISSLEEALVVKERDLEAANRMCHELGAKLTVAEKQLVFLQRKNTANEQSVFDLQGQVDSLLESQAHSRKCDGELFFAVQKLVHITKALAQATGTESEPTATSEQRESSLSTSNSIVMSLHWQDTRLDTLMSSLMLSANAFLQTGADVFNFVVEFATTLDYILVLQGAALENLRNDRDTSASEWLAISTNLESARGQISQKEEELCRIRAEQADAEMKVQVEMERLPQFEAEIMQLKADKNELENNLLDMDQHLVKANERVEGLKVRLKEAERLVTDLQTRQAAQDNEKEEDLLERELLELSTPSRRLEASMRTTDAEMHQLHDKVAALEVELHGERQRHQEVVSKLEDLQEQIHRGVGQMDHYRGHANNKDSERLELALVENDATKSARKEQEIAAAALAECQSTILALGKQLEVLGLQEAPTELTLVNSLASPNSIEKMTRNMEFLRSQADDCSAPPAAAPRTSLMWAPRSDRPAFPGLYYRQNNNNGTGYKNGTNTSTDGPMLLNIELPDPSIPDSTPASPARILRSVRTIRGATSMKASEHDKSINSTNVEGVSLDSISCTTSTFRQFYSRSQSETSMSSDNSNPGPV